MSRTAASSIQSLAREQFDRKLPELQAARDTFRLNTPAHGWIGVIRTLLGMSTHTLARRLKMAQPSLRALEKGELSGTITVASLKRLAQALDADFVYAIVPKKSVGETLHARARELARERVLPVAKSMQLEAQGLTAAQIERRVDEVARDLEQRPRGLWR
jgi:predicted DNA-binding mobile mystery protein A